MAKMLEQSDNALGAHGDSWTVEREVEIANDGATQEETCAPTARPSSLPWVGPMPRSGYGMMAVVNKEGYLVPLWTAADLLRACKIIWQATKD